LPRDRRLPGIVIQRLRSQRPRSSVPRAFGRVRRTFGRGHRAPRYVRSAGPVRRSVNAEWMVCGGIAGPIPRLTPPVVDAGYPGCGGARSPKRRLRSQDVESDRPATATAGSRHRHHGNGIGRNRRVASWSCTVVPWVRAVVSRSKPIRAEADQWSVATPSRSARVVEQSRQAYTRSSLFPKTFANWSVTYAPQF